MRTVHQAILSLVIVTALTATALAAPADERVLVAGATGRTGVHIVQQLQERGYTVRTLVRDAAGSEDKLGPDVELVVGDARQPATLEPAFADVDLVISTIGTGQKEGPNSPEFVDYGGNVNLTDAAREAGVTRFVLVSSMGVTHEEHPLNKMFGNILIWKKAGEDYLRASGVPYTIVRPGGLVDKPGGQKRVVFEQSDTVKAVGIAREDVATVCVAALDRDDARNKVFEVFTVKTGDGQPPSTDWDALFAALQNLNAI